MLNDGENTMAQPATYKYDLGRGLYLQAFAIDPKLTEKDLAEHLHAKDGTAKLDSDAIHAVMYGGSLDRFSELRLDIDHSRQYVVPAQLQAYREEVGRRSDAKGRYNGPVAIVDGPVNNPLSVFQGGYYDFVATKLGAVPHEIVPDQYPEGKTVLELFKEWGIDREERARYLGFAQALMTNGGDTINLVQRAKGMAIAPDCIALSGSTPNPELNKPGFDFQTYCQKHIADELKEEFGLTQEQFQLGGVHLFDDQLQSPCAALEIITPLSSQDLAQRVYGSAQAIQEHPIIFSVPREALDVIVQRFEMFSSTVPILQAVANMRS